MHDLLSSPDGEDFFCKPLETAAKRRWESEGIGVTRPLCGIQRDGNRKSQGALARSRSGRVCRRQRTAPLCEFPGSKPQAGYGVAAQS